MLKRTLPILLGAVLALSVTAFPGTSAYAQSSTATQPVKPTTPYKPSAQSTQKKAPGKSCSDFVSNSQAHKDCIAKQAKSNQKADQAAKKAKKKT